jgi:Transposase
MARGKKHTAEQVVNLLRQVEVGVANGKTLPQACKEAEIVEQTYYRWRKEYGGLKVDQARTVPHRPFLYDDHLARQPSAWFWSTRRSNARPLAASPRPVCFCARNHVYTWPCVQRARA